MKVIYPNNVTGVIASSENANFPATNLQTDYVGEKWKASATHTAVLTVSCSSGDGVALFGTNAVTASVVITQTGTAVTWATGTSWADTVEWVTVDQSPSVDYDLSSSSVGALWAEYTERTGSHLVKITLTTNVGTVIEAGVVIAGTVVEIADPGHGIQEGFEDYSTIHQLNSGAYYIDKENIARTFNFQINVERDSAFYDFLYDVYLLLGPRPAAWRILHKNVTDWEWVVYGALLRPPTGKHQYPNRSIIQMGITEMV